MKKIGNLYIEKITNVFDKNLDRILVIYKDENEHFSITFENKIANIVCKYEDEMLIFAEHYDMKFHAKYLLKINEEMQKLNINLYKF